MMMSVPFSGEFYLRGSTEEETVKMREITLEASLEALDNCHGEGPEIISAGRDIGY